MTVLMVFLMFFPLDGSVPSDISDLITTTEMVSWMERRNTWIQQRNLFFSHEQYWGADGSNAPTVPDTQSLVYSANWSVSLANDWYRYEKTFTRVTAQASDLLRAVVVQIWNGETASQLTVRKKNGGNQERKFLIIANEPISSHWEEDWLWWLGLRAPWAEKHWSYLDILKSEDVVGPLRSADGVHEWYAATPYENVVCHLFSRRAANGAIRIDRVRIVYTLADGSPWTNVEIQYDYNESVHQNDETLHFVPSHMHLQKSITRKEHPKEQWVVANITLASHFPNTSSASWYQTTIGDSTEVWDERHGIGYTTGNTLVNIDGRLLRTNRPLQGDVGADLGKWIHTGVFLDAVPINPSLTDFSSKQPSIHAKIWFHIGFIFFVFAAIFVFQAAIKIRGRRGFKGRYSNCALLAFGLFLLGCADQGPQNRSYTIDLGTHTIDQDVIAIPFDIDLVNYRHQEISVSEITSSCGCVVANASVPAVPSGGTLNLTGDIKISHAGSQNQRVIVAYVDGSRDVIVISVKARRDRELKPVPSRITLDTKRNAVVLLTRIDYYGDPICLPPKVVSPSDVFAEADEWATIEKYDLNDARPTRQTSAIRLDFGVYSGDFPVQVILEDSIGTRCVIRVYER